MTKQTNISSGNNRIIAIDILKVMAVLVVLNSHMELCYGSYASLATGGAFGDALFFFASGFMLFRGSNLRFDNFMKRRISRIYPTVIIVAITGAWLFNRNDNIISIILSGGGWFVSCIMIYYAVIWAVKRYFRNLLWVVWLAVGIVVIFGFYFGFDYSDGASIYGNTYYKWSFFFIYMLQGAIIGSQPEKYKYDKWCIPKLIGCICLWYGCMFAFSQTPLLYSIQYVSLLPLGGVTFYSYKLCCAPWWKRLYEHAIIGQIIFIIGGLCLECYLIQGFFFTDKLNWLFPANIPIIMIFILLISYIINFMSSALAQTFRKEEYDWSKCLLKKP